MTTIQQLGHPQILRAHAVAADSLVDRPLRRHRSRDRGAAHHDADDEIRADGHRERDRADAREHTLQQLTHANKQLRTYLAEIERTMSANTLPQLQAVVGVLDQTFKSGIEANARHLGQRNDLGGLKRAALDEIARQRNTFAKDVMQTALMQAAR